MEQDLGKVFIAPGVLVTIARLTALSVPGVVRMSRGWPDSVSHFLGRTVSGEGVRIQVEDNTVSVALSLIVERDKSILELAHAVQAEVARAIEEIVGMAVKEVNVHIQDVEGAQHAAPLPSAE